MAISGPPNRKGNQPITGTTSATEEKILSVINQGGRPTAKSEENREATQMVLKSINVKLTIEELDKIKHLRGLRPRPGRNRKISISVHDWIVEAVQEKIEREGKTRPNRSK